MMSRFSSFVLALLLLVASGQAFAATCTSAAGGGGWGTQGSWVTPTAGATNCTDATIGTWVAPTSADDVIVASTTALTGVATMAAKTLKINASSIFSPLTQTLTITPATTTDAFVNNGTFTKGTGTIAFAAAATTVGTIDFNNLSISAGALTLSGATTIGGNLVLTSTGNVLLAATNTVTGNVTTYGTALTGILKFVDAGTAIANHTITASSAATIPTLDTSAMYTGSSVIFSGAVNNIIGTLILPTANAVGGSAKTVIFKVPSTQTLQIPAAFNTASTATTAGCVATGYTFTGGLMTGTATATDNVTCTVPAATAPSTTSAPIFSTKEKAAVFSQEVK